MKKKLLFMMPALPGGGAEKVLIDILRNFDYQRYEIHLFLEYEEGIYLCDVPGTVKMWSLHQRSTIGLERWHRILNILHCYSLYHSIVYRWMFLSLLKKERFDTIISFMEGAAVRFHSYIMNRADKNISWVHIDLKKKHWSLGFFGSAKEEGRCYSLMDKIVFVSVDAEKGFRELYSIDNDQCCVLYNLIDSRKIAQLARQKAVCKQKPVVCMAGRLNEQKRYDRALRVAKRLKEDGFDWDFWVLGTGELEQLLTDKLEEYHLKNYFHFLGFVKPAYVFMSNADIFLNTSEAEGYPLTICEALCLGLPIVATNIAGAREILESSQYGLLVSETEESIYQGLRSMMEHQELREKYHHKALERARIFSVEETMNRIYELV